MKKKDGSKANSRSEVETICQNFYTELFASKKVIPLELSGFEEEEVPPVMAWEVEKALKQTKKGKAPGLDEITNEMLRAGGDTLWKILAELFTECLEFERIPAQ